MEAQSNSGNLILVIDDEEGVLDVIERFLAKNGFEVRTEAGAEAGLEFIRKNNVDLILVDMMMPGMGGLEFVRAAKDMKYPAEVMVMSGFGTVESAVDAIRFGAFDFIEKPLNFEKLLIDIQNAIKKSRLEDRIEFLENRIKSNIEFDGIVGNSTEFLKTKKLAEQISRTEVNLLITGESGTGKEVFARAVHNAGPRCGGPFMAVNCGAIAESLLESELFGHEKGAFSGAVARRTGHFENADGGTLFLDEIGELPMSLQVKLLRAVQEKEIMRVGSSRPVRVDCRIISATNRNLEKEVEKGTFREDLFYRLNVIELKIPPLRERAEDIPLLAAHFLRKLSNAEKTFDPPVLDDLQNYRWPGNVRELENVMQRAIALCPASLITSDLLPEKFRAPGEAPKRRAAYTAMNFKEAQEQMIKTFERDFIVEAISRNEGNILKTAEEIGLTRQTLHRMINKHGISPKEFKK